MLKKIFQILFLISVAACFTSCDDVNNNPDSSEAYDVAPEMKIYFDSFKKGSWWVLASDITNRRDSIVVDSVERYLDQGIAERPTWIYSVQLKVYSTSEIYNNLPFVLNNYTMYEGRYSEASMTNKYVTFSIEYDSIENTFHSDLIGWLQLFQTNLSLNGILFEKVLTCPSQFNRSSFNPENGFITLAPNIGFLKFESQTDTLALRNYFIP